MEQNSEIIFYTDSDGTTKLQVQLEDETVWLTQDQMSMLFGKAKSTINEHIKNIYAEEELEESQTLKKFGISEFQQKAPNYYNLDVIISVGYRVKSIQGTRFRQWATKRIHEYIVKGFTMDDDRLKQEGARSRYFEELLTDAGKVSHKKAVEKAITEYEKYRKAADTKYISDFDREMKKLLKDEHCIPLDLIDGGDL